MFEALARDTVAASGRGSLYDAAVTADGLPLSRYEAAVVNLLGDRLTATVVTALEAHGVPAIVLKAASIREWLYREDEDRGSCDVDLLVPAVAREQVDVCLRRVGLRYLGPTRLGRGRPRDWIWQEPATRMLVELHQSISGIGVDSATAWSVLSEGTDRTRIAGEEVDVLDVPRRALHLALHAAHHGPALPRPIEDLARGLAAVPDETWRDASIIAERLDAVPAFVAGLRLAHGGRELASRLGLTDVAAAPPDVALRAAGAPPVAEGLAWLFGVRGARAKLAFLAQALVPPPSAMRAWRPLARRSTAGLAALYLWRPFWLARHAVPAYAAVRRVRRAARETTDARAPGGAWLALRMGAWSAALPLLKRVVPLLKLARLAWAGGAGGRNPRREREIVRLSGALPRLRLARSGANCLERSLLAYRFLAQANADPRLVVGVRREEGAMVGHAWVTLDGRPVHDTEAAVRQFVPVVEFGPDGLPLGERTAAEKLPDHWE